MRVRANATYPEFAARIKEWVKPIPYHGVTFRSVLLEFATPEHLLNGEGSRLFGGRWNPPGIPVIYTSTRPGTAVEEAFQLAADFELAPDGLKPRITCGIEWELSALIDLTVKKLPSWVELEKWTKEDFQKINDNGFETLCQAFGRAVRDAGIVGLICPSARVRGGINLVAFRECIRKSDKMRVLGRTQLARYLA